MSPEPMSFSEYLRGGVVFRAARNMETAGGVVHAFSTRLGGVSEGALAAMNLGTTRGDEPERVRENYRRFCAAAGLRADRLAMSNQVHGNHVRVITVADIKRDIYDPEGYQADGLVTDIPGITLTVFSADCIPVLLYDPVRRVAAAVHAGWMGTAKGVVRQAAEKMIQLYGCKPADILAAIGPGISKCCFETHADVPNAMTEGMGAQALPCIRPLEGGKYMVDLKELNACWLKGAGISPTNIAIDAECTMCSPDKYWSHRAHGAQRGSQAAMIALAE